MENKPKFKPDASLKLMDQVTPSPALPPLRLPHRANLWRLDLALHSGNHLCQSAVWNWLSIPV